MHIPEHEFELFHNKWIKSRGYDKQVAIFFRKLEVFRVVLNLVESISIIHSDHMDAFSKSFDALYKLHSEQFDDLLQQEDFRVDFFRVLEHDHFNPEKMLASFKIETSTNSSTQNIWT